MIIDFTLLLPFLLQTFIQEILMTHSSNLCKWFEERKKFGMNGNSGNFSSFVM